MRKRKANSSAEGNPGSRRAAGPIETAAIDALAEQLASYLPAEQIGRVRGA
jgi:hypothetical protein